MDLQAAFPDRVDRLVRPQWRIPLRLAGILLAAAGIVALLASPSMPVWAVAVAGGPVLAIFSLKSTQLTKLGSFVERITPWLWGMTAIAALGFLVGGVVVATSLSSVDVAAGEGHVIVALCAVLLIFGAGSLFFLEAMTPPLFDFARPRLGVPASLIRSLLWAALGVSVLVSVAIAVAVGVPEASWLGAGIIVSTAIPLLTAVALDIARVERKRQKLLASVIAAIAAVEGRLDEPRSSERRTQLAAELRTLRALLDPPVHSIVFPSVAPTTPALRAVVDMLIARFSGTHTPPAVTAYSSLFAPSEKVPDRSLTLMAFHLLNLMYGHLLVPALTKKHKNSLRDAGPRAP